MNIEIRLQLLSQLGEYLKKNTEEWQEAKYKAERENGWFTQTFIELAVNNIIDQFLNIDKLRVWSSKYKISDELTGKKVGIVMAGNIPLVGFNDLLCVFVCGHKAVIKASSKDEVLLKFIVQKLFELNAETRNLIEFSIMLKDCDAYIATGSNNSGRYFEQYFAKYPHIIRRNRTSIAILKGDETREELDNLADDINVYFGMGCRNVTKLYVPQGYDFIDLISALKKYDYFIDHNKYKNNYDYQLAISLLNNQYYMSSKAVLLTENKQPFTPVSNLHYEFYANNNFINELNKEDIQCIIGKGYIAFGAAQTPSLFDYADGIDTIEFLSKL